MNRLQGITLNNVNKINQNTHLNTFNPLNPQPSTLSTLNPQVSDLSSQPSHLSPQVSPTSGLSHLRSLPPQVSL